MSKIQKRVIPLLLAGVLVFSISVYADANIVNYNGEDKTLQNPMIQNAVVQMISIRDVTSLMGGTVSWDSYQQSISVKVGDTAYLFKPHRQEVTVGKDIVIMDAAAIIQNGISYIPVTALHDVLGLVVSTDAGNLVKITSSKVEVEAYGEYTFEQLYQLALKNSSDLDAARINIDSADVVRELSRDIHSSGVSSGTGTGASAAVLLNSLKSLKSSEISVESAKIAYLTVEDRVEYQLRSLIDDKIVSVKSIALKKQAYDLKVIGHDQNRLKYEQGLISEYEYAKSALDLGTVKSALETELSKGKSIDSALEDMLKLGVENYDFLSGSRMVQEVLTDRDLDSHITDVINYSPTIWALEKALEMSQLDVRFHVYNYTGSDLIDVDKNDVTKAKLNLTSAKEATDLALRQSYEGIVQLEQGMDSIQMELEKAKKDLNMALTNYNVGLITKYTLQQAQYAVDAYEYQQLSLQKSYNALVRAYLHPWAAQ